jgi:hypothetical protein
MAFSWARLAFAFDIASFTLKRGGREAFGGPEYGSRDPLPDTNRERGRGFCDRPALLAGHGRSIIKQNMLIY